jgi:hypothetical protein
MTIRSFNIEKRQDVDKIINSVHSATISFEEICPQWSLALQIGYTNNPDLDIHNARHCIVGEAHGFRNMALRCSKCWEYSQSFTFCVYGNKMHKYVITDNQRFEDLKFDFVSHFNQKHLPNQSHQQSTLNLPIVRLSRILKRIRNLSLPLFLHQIAETEK